MDYFRQQAGRLLVVGIMTVHWIYRQLLALAHSGPEQYRYILARLQVYRALLGTGTEDVQRRHSKSLVAEGAPRHLHEARAEQHARHLLHARPRPPQGQEGQSTIII